MVIPVIMQVIHIYIQKSRPQARGGPQKKQSSPSKGWHPYEAPASDDKDDEFKRFAPFIGRERYQCRNRSKEPRQKTENRRSSKRNEEYMPVKLGCKRLSSKRNKECMPVKPQTASALKPQTARMSGLPIT